jgi:hypothetical protein
VGLVTTGTAGPVVPSAHTEVAKTPISSENCKDLENANEKIKIKKLQTYNSKEKLAYSYE